MLFQKLLKPASASTGIQYVGARTGSGSTSGGTVTVSLTTLTGGIASAAAIGDVVVIVIGVAGATNAPASPTVTGYTLIDSAGANDTNATCIYVGYKILTAADTSVAYTWTASNGSSTAYVSVWRNVDATYPLDVNAITVGVQNTILANPNSITPVTSGAYIIAAGAGASSAGVQSYSSSDLTDFKSTGLNASYDSVIGGGYNEWTSGAFNPAAFTFSTSNSSAYSNATTILALRPTGKTNPSFIASNGVLNTGGSGSVSIPSHNSGDWIIFVNATQNASIPSLASGFTNICTFTNTATGSNRSARVQYIVSDGTITSLSCSYYGNVAILRNVNGIGTINTFNSTAATGALSIPVGLFPNVPGSLCLIGSYDGVNLTNKSANLTLATSFGAYATTNAIASVISGTLTFSVNEFTCQFNVEFY